MTIRSSFFTVGIALLGITGSWAQSKNAETAIPFRTPAEQFAQFVSDHPSENSFLSGLEKKWVAKFSPAQSETEMRILCMRMTDTGTLGLSHPSIQSLGIACQSQDLSKVKIAFTKISDPVTIGEFKSSLSGLIHAQGGLAMFSRDLARTLRGSENPLAAFGIFVLFAS